VRVLGAHPRDKKPVELHAGRYGPYVKHGGVNATLPDRDKVESLTLAEAVMLLDEKAGKQEPGTPAKPKRRAPAKTAAEPRAAYSAAVKIRKSPPAKPTPAPAAALKVRRATAPKVKRASTVTAKAVPKTKPKPAAKSRRVSAK
jgi:DNA topoisomerase-1